MPPKTQIPGFSKYEITKDSVVYKTDTEIIMTETEGKVQLISDTGRRSKQNVEQLKKLTAMAVDVHSIMKKHETPKTNESGKKKTMAGRIRELQAKGVGSNDIAIQLNCRVNYVSNVGRYDKQKKQQ